MVIATDGSFIGHFTQVLVGQQLLWSSETELEVPSEALLKITIKSEESSQIFLSVKNRKDGTDTSIIAQQEIKTSQAKVGETTYVWSLEPHTMYYLETQHQKQELSGSKCSYLDVTISIATIDYLSNRLSCNTLKGVKPLRDALPAQIQSTSLPYILRSRFIIQYPGDFGAD